MNPPPLLHQPQKKRGSRICLILGMIILAPFVLGVFGLIIKGKEKPKVIGPDRLIYRADALKDTDPQKAIAYVEQLRKEHPATKEAKDAFQIEGQALEALKKVEVENQKKAAIAAAEQEALEAAMKAEIIEAESIAIMNEDKFEGTKFYFINGFPSELQFYIGVKGSKTWLCVKGVHDATDQNYLKNVRLKFDGNIVDLPAKFTGTSFEMEGDKLEERYNIASDSFKSILEAAIVAKEITIRMEGRKTVEDIPFATNQVFRSTALLYRAKGGQIEIPIKLKP